MTKPTTTDNWGGPRPATRPDDGRLRQGPKPVSYRLRLPPEMMTWLKAMAAKRGMSVNALVVEMIASARK